MNDTTVEGRGTVNRDSIVLDASLGLPEGTEVEVKVRVIWRPPAKAANDTDARKVGPIRPELTNEQLLAWARQHPAPMAWWDATDNPFEP